MALKINDVFTFAETRLVAQIPALTNRVKVTKENEPYPAFKDYGVQMYLGDNPKEIVAKKIGNVIHEIWHPNLDFLFNRNLKSSRELYSDSLGLSYWENAITAALLHQTNNGAFVNSWWEFERQENLADCIKLKGKYHVEILNRY